MVSVSPLAQRAFPCKISLLWSLSASCKACNYILYISLDRLFRCPPHSWWADSHSKCRSVLMWNVFHHVRFHITVTKSTWISNNTLHVRTCVSVCGPWSKFVYFMHSPLTAILLTFEPKASHVPVNRGLLHTSYCVLDSNMIVTMLLSLCTDGFKLLD